MELSLTSLDLREFIRPGDTVLWGQGAGEPRTLTERLVEQRSEFSGVTVLLGASYSETIRPAHSDHLRLIGLGAIGTNRALARAGVLDVLPCHVSDVPRLLESGRLRVDVVMMQLSPGTVEGQYSFGLVCDFLPAAIARARTVIAEVNDRVPFVYGESVSLEKADRVIWCSRPPVEVSSDDLNPVAEAIGRRVSDLVEDGDVLQLGLGGVMESIGRCLIPRKNLGIHTGVVGDWILPLAESGALTNQAKLIDKGVTVTGAIFGSERLNRYVDHNATVSLRSVGYTHDSSVLRDLDRFVAINSAIEVDLTGQVNSESARGYYVGAVGGAAEFMRAAHVATGGKSIVALPSTAYQGTVSRIVAKLTDNVTSIPRSDVDFIVTEYGTADLRGASLGRRVRELLKIAHPEFREELEFQVQREGSIC